MQDRINQQSICEVLRRMNQPQEPFGVLPFYLAMTRIRDTDGRRMDLE